MTTGNPTSFEDVALVQAMARGDRSAFSTLYDRHAPSLLALGQRIVGRGPEAEDVVHDVFLEAWRRAGEYDPARGTVKTWLLLRTRSRALDVQKSARIAKLSPNSDERVREVADPRGEESFGADRQRLRFVLLGLPADQREVLLLGYFEGLSSSEIAERVGIPLGTVKSRVAAALSALRAALSDPATAEP